MNNQNVHKMWLAFYVVIFVLVSGCTSSSRSGLSRYNLQFRAHPQINNFAPLKVRVLQLKSDAEFMSSDFHSLQNNESDTLGANLLNSDVFFLVPGQISKTLGGRSSPEARYICVMAEYQVLNGKKWRLSFPLLAPGETRSWQFWIWFVDELKINIFLDVNGIRSISQ